MNNDISIHMVSIHDIHRIAGTDVLDYQQLVSMLGDYAKPRDRVSAMLRKGELISIRKGLYALGDAYRHGPLVRGQLANLIYGPSYVSLDYALGHYGMIPERVDEITSVTTGKHRVFETPFGVFSYRPLPPSRYVPGVVLEGEEKYSFLMAAPEKALVDKVWCDKRFKPRRLDDYGAYLFDDLRLEKTGVLSLDRALLGTIASAFASRRITMLVRFIERLGRRAS